MFAELAAIGLRQLVKRFLFIPSRKCLAIFLVSDDEKTTEFFVKGWSDSQTLSRYQLLPFDSRARALTVLPPILNKVVVGSFPVESYRQLRFVSKDDTLWDHSDLNKTDKFREICSFGENNYPLCWTPQDSEWVSRSLDAKSQDSV